VSVKGVQSETNHLTVGLGNTLELVLLLDGVRGRRLLGSVDKLISEALSNGLHVAEGGLTGTGGEEPDGLRRKFLSEKQAIKNKRLFYLVDAAEGRHINSLATDSAGGTNAGRVFAGTSVDDSIDEDLNGVLHNGCAFQ